MLPAGILATALFALLAFAPFASAASDPVGGGNTTLTLNGGWTNYLKTFGIKVQKEGSTKLSGKKATFTNTGGSVDPLTGLGEVTLGGGLKFKAGKKKAPVKAMVLNTSKKAIFAKVAGKQMKFATVAGWSQVRNGFGVNITVKKLKLTNSAASQLNKKTGYAKGKPKPFIKNKLIGKSASEVVPSTVVVLPSGNATLALSKEALEKLAKVGPTVEVGPGVFANPFAVKLAPVAPTTVTNPGPPPTVAFPISGGTMGPTGTAGTLQTAGGLTLKQNLEAAGPNGAGETTLTLGNIYVDMATKQATVEVSITNPKTPAANLGNLGRASIADLVIGSVTADPATRTVSVTNAAATLQAVTAETLNSVFIKPIEDVTKAPDDVKFAAGDPLGTFSFTAQTE
ncbi:MAG: hypothetical protein AB7T48_03805 [Solirubrobacterales bacterium]